MAFTKETLDKLTLQILDKLALFLQNKKYTVVCEPHWDCILIVFENGQEKFSMQRSFNAGRHWVHIMIPNEDKISIENSKLSTNLYTKANHLYVTLGNIYTKQEEARKEAEKEKNEQKLKEAHQSYLSAEHKKQTQILDKLNAYLK